MTPLDPGAPDPRVFSTDYLKRIWDHMGLREGVYLRAYVVQDEGHTVNGLWIDDVYWDLAARGEGSYVAV